MPDGKPAGVRCVQLDEVNRCGLFGRTERPAVCAALSPVPEMCGEDGAQAIEYLTWLEMETRPDRR